LGEKQRPRAVAGSGCKAASDRRVADIVQCGPSADKALPINTFSGLPKAWSCKLLISLNLQLAALDDVRNWLIREAA